MRGVWVLPSEGSWWSPVMRKQLGEQQNDPVCCFCFQLPVAWLSVAGGSTNSLPMLTVVVDLLVQ